MRPVSSRYLLLLTLILLLLLRVPFFFTHHVQEDAYISLRCAENLAETGVYGFNPGEKVSSSTSHLYVFFAALIRLLVGHNAYIPVMQVLNTLFFLAGTYFLACVFFDQRKDRLLLWLLISALPVALLISYSGMETSLLIFLIGSALYLHHTQRKPWLAYLVMALLPWVRPDAVAYSLLIIFWGSLRDRKLQWGSILAVLGGVTTLILFNRVYFGTLLHQSINAKLLMRHSFSLGGILQNMGIVFIGQADGGMFSPIRTKYLGGFGVVFLLLILAGVTFYLWKNRHDRKALITGLVVVSMSLLIPLAYAFGGVLYQWYFWPSALLGYVVVLAAVFRSCTSPVPGSRLIRGLLFVGLIAGILAQLAFSYAWGVKEYAYRGGIGVWLQQQSRSTDRILLEPAGYIPYYSDLYTYDEVGLVSPQVVTYRQAYELRWWPEFVMDFQPEWIIQRGHIADFTTYQGYQFAAVDREWFQDNYQLAGTFHFNPAEFTFRPFLLQLLALGETDEYYVFQRK